MSIAWDGWQGLLAEDLGAGVTTLYVVDATGAPPAPFDFSIALERLTCTEQVNSSHGPLTQWTIVRGVNGSPVVSEGYFAGAGLAEIRQQFLVYNAGRVIDLTMIAEGISPSWSIPGGDSACTISFHTYDPARYFPDPEAVLRISSNETGGWQAHWSGILTVPKEIRLDDGGYHYELVFTGLIDTLSDDIYLSTTPPSPGFYDSGVGWWAAFTPIHQVVQDAIRDKGGPFVSLDWTHVIDGGQQIGKEYNGLWKSPLEIINELCSQGDTGEALDHAVFTNADGSAAMWLYRRSRWLAITIPWGAIKLPETVPLSWNTKDRKTSVAIKYGAGTMEAAGGVPGRRKVWLRDCSNTIQDSATAYALAKTILSQASVYQTLTEQPVVLEYKADDPSIVYLTDHAGGEIPLWRGDKIAGRLATISGVTTNNAKWPISAMQVKTVTVDYATRKTTCQMGKYVDWFTMANQYNYQDQKRPDSPTHIPGASSAFASPPAALPPIGATSSNVPVIGPNNGIGHKQIAEDADIGDKQWVYDVVDGSALPEGSYGDLTWHVRGEVIGFRFQGRSPTDTATSGVITIAYGTAASPLAPTLSVAPITLSGEAKKTVNLSPGVVAGSGGAIPIEGNGDYLRLTITTNDEATGFAHITVTPLFRRFEGSDRGVSFDGAEIQSVSHTTDPDTGVVTFHITADRPVYAYVAFDIQAGPYRSVTGTTTVLSTTPEPSTYAIPTGVTMHGSAVLITPEGVQTVGPDFTF